MNYRECPALHDLFLTFMADEVWETGSRHVGFRLGACFGFDSYIFKLGGEASRESKTCKTKSLGLNLGSDQNLPIIKSKSEVCAVNTRVNIDMIINNTTYFC